MNIPIYIATSNNFLPLLKPFCYLFNKFWSPTQTVNFLGYNIPEFNMPDNFNFISLGEQRGINYWGDDMIDFLSNTKESHFIYTAEDQFLIDHVNLAILSELLKFINDDNVGRICLNHGAAETSHFTVNTSNNFNIIELHQSANWRNSLQWAIWDKNHFLKYVSRGMSQWAFEKSGLPENSHIKNNGIRILGSSKRFAINNCNAVKTGGSVERFNFQNLNLNSIVSRWADGSMKSKLDDISINELKLNGLLDE